MSDFGERWVTTFNHAIWCVDVTDCPVHHTLKEIPLSKSHVRRMRGTKSLVLFCPLAIALAASAQSTSITAAGFSEYWGTSNTSYDLDGNGIVNGTDLSIFLAGSGSGGGSDPGSGLSSGSSSSTTVDAPLLIPGSGFAGVTAQPQPVGASPMPGFDAQAIARWDAVAYQEFSQESFVGVVAFHMNGIESVRFSANGGPWVSVTSAALNPNTGVVEYFVKLRPQDYGTSAVELRAIVTPIGAGVARVLQGSFEQTRPNAANQVAFRNGMHSMFVRANSTQPNAAQIAWVSAASGNDLTGTGSSTAPFATITRAATRLDAANAGAGGCTVMLLPGDYSIVSPATFAGPANKVRTPDRWLTIRAAEGVAPSAVRIVACTSGGLGTRLLKFQGLTFYEFTGIRTVSSIDTFLWVDQCKLTSSNRFIDTGGLATNGWAAVYATGCEAFETRQSLRAATFVRNCSVHQFSETPFGGDATIFNCTVDEYCKYQTDHADVIHWFWNTPADRENRIIFGLKATRFGTQGLFAESIVNGCQRLDDVALVNVHISQDRATPSGSWWQLDTNHLLYWNIQMPDQPLRMKTSETRDLGGQLVITNASMRNCIWSSLHGPQIPQGAAVAHVHLINPTYGYVIPKGTDVTCGRIFGGSSLSPIFVNPTALDFRVKPQSAAFNRVTAAEALTSARIGSSATLSPTSILPLGAFASVE